MPTTTETEIRIGPDRVLDVREIPCSIKHSLIIKTFVGLPVDDYFILRNGHDPVPLRYQFEAEFPGACGWDYVHRLPDDVAVKITKLRTVADSAPEGAHCCGD